MWHLLRSAQELQCELLGCCKVCRDWPPDCGHAADRLTTLHLQMPMMGMFPSGIPGVPPQQLPMATDAAAAASHLSQPAVAQAMGFPVSMAAPRDAGASGANTASGQLAAAVSAVTAALPAAVAAAVASAPQQQQQPVQPPIQPQPGLADSPPTAVASSSPVVSPANKASPPAPFSAPPPTVTAEGGGAAPAAAASAPQAAAAPAAPAPGPAAVVSAAAAAQSPAQAAAKAPPAQPPVAAAGPAAPGATASQSQPGAQQPLLQLLQNGRIAPQVKVEGSSAACGGGRGQVVPAKAAQATVKAEPKR